MPRYRPTESEETVAQRVTSVIGRKLCIMDEDIIPSKRFEDDFGADSLDRVNLMLELEDEFKISITDEDLETFRTVGDVIRYMEDRRG